MSKLFVNTIAPNSGDTVTISGSLTTIGKLTIGDESTDTVAITAEITSSLIPDIDNRFDLGSSAKQWKTLHATTASFNVVSSSLIPDGNEVGSSGIQDSTYDLGSNAKKWRTLYARNISASGAISGVTNITASGVISASSYVGLPNGIFSGSAQLPSGIFSGSAQLPSGIFSSSLQIFTSITASGNISASSFSITKATAASQDLNTSAEYSVNGNKVEVRAITAGAIADGTFESFKLLNTSIQSDSVVLGSFTGNTAGLITGSIITAATTGSGATASIQIHNETGASIGADTPFTASFIVI